MNDARLWIVLVAIVSFLAGSAAGILTARVRATPPAAGWPAYAEWIGSEFELDPERRQALRVLLDQYATELESRRRAHAARIHAELEPELHELAVRYEAYIRDHVLPPSQRARFDALSLPHETLATAH